MSNMKVEDIAVSLKLEIAPEQMEVVFHDLLKGYEKYMQEHSQNSMDTLVAQMMQYLQSKEAALIVKEGIEEAIKENGKIEITDAQMQSIINDVIVGYDAYAKEHDFIGIDDVNGQFMEYLASKDAQVIMSQSMEKLVQSMGIANKLMQIRIHHLRFLYILKILKAKSKYCVY